MQSKLSTSFKSPHNTREEYKGFFWLMKKVSRRYDEVHDKDENDDIKFQARTIKRERRHHRQRHTEINSQVRTFKSTTYRSGFIFVRTIFVQKGKCSSFLELTRTL